MVAALATQGSPGVIRFRRAGDRRGARAPRPASGPNPETHRIADAVPTQPSVDVLARARSGDGRAFGVLVRQHEADVLRLCRRLLGSASEAEDVCQETFARAQVALAGYDPARPFRRWLLAIAAHRAIDVLRRRRTERALFEPGPAPPDAIAGAAPSPLELGLRAEERARLLALIEALPEKYRAPLLLRYYADLDPAEIAEILGVSRNQVATLLFRARRRLRVALGEAGGGPGDAR